MAATDYGLLSSGFSIPSFSEWQQLYFDGATSAFGADANVDTDSILGQILSISAYQDMIIWQALDSVYSSQTVDGAEGIYLDEIFNRRGVYRKAAYAGTGYAFLATDSTGLWTDTIPTTTYFSATNGENYSVTTETALRTNISAWCFSKAQATSASNSLILYIQNTDTGATVTKTFTTTNSDFASNVVEFILANVATEDQSLVWYDSSTNNIYVGFNESLVTPSSSDITASTTISPVGLGTSTMIYANQQLGVKWSLIPVECQETGSYPVAINGISAVSPTPTGYFSTGNFTAFDAGSAVETDAEYRIRFNATSDEATSATKPAIYKAVSDLSDVTAVRIYDNATLVDTEEADAQTFNTVVFGGAIEEIAETIYDRKPINTLTSGTTSYTVSTEDGGTEIIKFTYGTSVPYSIEVKYKTATGISLSATQKSNIEDGFVVLADSFISGSTIFNGQLAGVVYKELDFGVLTYISVLTKLQTADSTAYTTSDIAPSFSELVTFDTENITFSYVTD